MMREAGVYCEVEPRHLFNTLLPAAYLLQPTPRCMELGLRFGFSFEPQF